MFLCAEGHVRSNPESFGTGIVYMREVAEGSANIETLTAFKLALENYSQLEAKLEHAEKAAELHTEAESIVIHASEEDAVSENVLVDDLGLLNVGDDADLYPAAGEGSTLDTVD